MAISTAIAQLAAAHPVIAAGIAGALVGGSIGIAIGQLFGGAGHAEVFRNIGGHLGGALDALGEGTIGAAQGVFGFQRSPQFDRPQGPPAPPAPSERYAGRDVNVYNNIAPFGDLYTESTGGLAAQVEQMTRRAISGGVLQAGIVPAGCVATRVAV